jgi:uncharacterized ParB-like nuclease family protein
MSTETITPDSISQHDSKPSMTTQTIPLASIRLDSGTQTRTNTNEEAVADYAEAMQDGAKFPPVEVFFDGTDYHLADGWHRFFAAQRAGCQDILATVHDGTAADAIWFAIGANKTNGIKRSAGDKRNAIAIAIAKFSDRTQEAIAQQVGCNQSTVQRVKAELMQTHKLTPPPTVAGKDGKSYPTTYAKRTLPPPPPMQPRTEPEPAEEAEPPRVTAHTPPPPPAVFTDETGWPVPTGLIELFRRGPEAQALLSAISTVRGALRTAQDTKDPLFLEVSFSRAQAELDNAYSEVKRAKPHAVCPTCKGQVKDRCLLCHGRGLISEFTWNTVVSREVKEFRFKAMGMKKGAQ